MPGIPRFSIPGFELRPSLGIFDAGHSIRFITAFILTVVDSPFGRITEKYKRS